MVFLSIFLCFFQLQYRKLLYEIFLLKLDPYPHSESSLIQNQIRFEKTAGSGSARNERGSTALVISRRRVGRVDWLSITYNDCTGN